MKSFALYNGWPDVITLKKDNRHEERHDQPIQRITTLNIEEAQKFHKSNADMVKIADMKKSRFSSKTNLLDLVDSSAGESIYGSSKVHGSEYRIDEFKLFKGEERL
ncbi:hypothetical protein K0M31_004011 [Melipona bicolor]|uniref:Uncharacterized protein n=1 Tax=Melipona bicolor TaxID=60889 RepID=A0AA40FYD4_9HYME|nr:hypothetical protein K0M31_004011 [Melipona bicolor]